MSELALALIVAGAVLALGIVLLTLAACRLASMADAMTARHVDELERGGARRA